MAAASHELSPHFRRCSRSSKLALSELPRPEELAVADHPNLATFRSIYAAFTTGDMDVLATFFEDNVASHTPGQHPLAGTYEGRAATFASLAEEFERSGGTYSVNVREVLASDDVLRCLRNRKRLGRLRAVLQARCDVLVAGWSAGGIDTLEGYTEWMKGLAPLRR